MRISKQLKIVATAICVMIPATGMALAATCSAGALGKIIQNNTSYVAACDAGSANNDNPLPGQVNGDSLFGYTDWLYAGKQNIGGAYENGSVNVGFTATNAGKSGLWSFVSDLFTKYQNAMIVLKGGAGNNTQETYVGYLLNATLQPNGTFGTPFFNQNNRNAKDISHVTAYVRGAITPPPPPPPSAVPVPAAGLLLVGGLGALVALRRRMNRG